MKLSSSYLLRRRHYADPTVSAGMQKRADDLALAVVDLLRLQTAQISGLSMLFIAFAQNEMQKAESAKSVETASVAVLSTQQPPQDSK